MDSSVQRFTIISLAPSNEVAAPRRTELRLLCKLPVPSGWASLRFDQTGAIGLRNGFTLSVYAIGLRIRFYGVSWATAWLYHRSNVWAIIARFNSTNALASIRRRRILNRISINYQMDLKQQQQNNRLWNQPMDGPRWQSHTEYSIDDPISNNNSNNSNNSNNNRREIKPMKPPTSNGDIQRGHWRWNCRIWPDRTAH